MINLKGITLESQKYCLRCNTFTSKGTLLDIRNLNDTEYLQLQECGWRRSGDQFYHTNQNSCCQQTISKVDVHDYQQPKTLKKALRKLTSEYFDIEVIKQSPYSNLLQYIDQTRPSALRTRSAFHDFLTALSERLPCTLISPKGFKSNSPDSLNFHVQTLNQELHMNVKVDSHNCLHFKWLNDFTKLLNNRKSLLQTVISQAHYNEEAHQFFNDHYFQIKKTNYIQNFCGDQYKMVKYYIQQELVAVGFLEIRQNSLHRLALHYKKDVNQISRIVLDADIQLAKSLNLTYFYYITITKNQTQFVNNKLITDDFVIQCGNKNTQIKNLREKYRDYMLDRLNYLNNYLTEPLINGIIFTYS